jgi:hypothetical protein
LTLRLFAQAFRRSLAARQNAADSLKNTNLRYNPNKLPLLMRGDRIDRDVNQVYQKNGDGYSAFPF